MKKQPALRMCEVQAAFFDLAGNAVPQPIPAWVRRRNAVNIVD